MILFINHMITDQIGLTPQSHYHYKIYNDYQVQKPSTNISLKSHKEKMRHYSPGKKTCVLPLDCDCDPALNDCRPCRLSSYTLSWVILPRLAVMPVADWSVTYAGAGCNT